MPCRGTGRVVSNLGGTANKVTCPWCNGEGVRLPDIDAQAKWSNVEETAAEADPPGEDAEDEQAA